MYPTQSTTEVATDDWARFHADLVVTLADLGLTHEGQMLNISVTRPQKPDVQEPRVGPLRRLIRAALGRQGRDMDPLLQFYRMRDSLYGECAGPADSDGWVKLTPEQQVGIETLGWARATGKDRGRWGYPNYCVYFPHRDGKLYDPHYDGPFPPYAEGVDIEEAARLAVDTLRGPLGADTPRKLTVIRGK